MLSGSSVGTMLLSGGGLITAILALFSARAAKNKTNSETDVNIAAVEMSRENLYQSREMFLHAEIERVKKELNLMKEEISSLRSLIESHAPWDWEVMRQLKLAGIDFREPPTLNYIQDAARKKDEK